MIIDGRTLNLNSTPFSSKTTIASRSEKEAAAIKQLMKENGKEGNILLDVELLGSTSNVDGFQGGFNIANNPNGIISGRIPVMSSKRTFNSEYTAADALYNNWGASTGKTALFGSRGGATVKSDDVLEMDKEQFLEYVRENGLDKEINWSKVDSSFDVSTQFEDFSDYTDYAAALYASLENRIKTDFSGDEQKSQLDKLNQSFETAVDKMSTRYVENLTYTFEPFGVELPEEELRQSIRDIMTAKKDAYSDFASNNTDYANLSDSEDKWLERDINYMASALKNVFDGEVSVNSEYSENDIIAVGMMANMYRFEALDANKGGFLEYTDEESVGLALSMNYLMLASAMDDLNAGDGAKKIGMDLFNKRSESIIDKVNSDLQGLSKNAPTWVRTPDKTQYTAEMFNPLNTDDVYAVLNKMIDTYEKTKDAEKAIFETTSFAYNNFINNQQKDDNILYRYNGDYDPSGERYFVSSKNFWNDFYDKGKGSSFMGKLIDKWNGFASALEEKDLNVLSGYTGSLFDTYREWKVFDKPLVGGYSAETGHWGDKL